MLQTISWSQYIAVIVLLLMGYYAYVGYKYYRWELLALIGIRKVETGNTSRPVEDFKQKMILETHTDYLPKESLSATNFLIAIEDEISAYLNGIADDIPSKKEVLDTLRVIVAKYPVSALSGNNNSLYQFILSKAEAVQPGIISQEDLSAIFHK
ncbi:MAG: hypothetical protein J0I09_02705 [Sphingobacteriia bacterium]|jgi:hypothetical protein|nr:hypothetical protein [Sphingobacteriia bacterium]